MPHFFPYNLGVVTSSLLLILSFSHSWVSRKCLVSCGEERKYNFEQVRCFLMSSPDFGVYFASWVRSGRVQIWRTCFLETFSEKLILPTLSLPVLSFSICSVCPACLLKVPEVEWCIIKIMFYPITFICPLLHTWDHEATMIGSCCSDWQRRNLHETHHF